ncbi:hypothetical protein FZI91_06410 [Mycobacterium sp. CBMA271]|uniref:hypothetical protein n=1 Tax=unclassified Mycobacteroides TaxID=2618759 RepID=UPI0012DC5F32|nr:MULTISPECIES: hypothetical protein [unclassified Mycobacteroides]MUM15437.1 hypothetical protein [Mycobacteroides sp. CBMA 326]MUM21337.1 hypothetical protein [Mycobacteroides sp. CBMA 271]
MTLVLCGCDTGGDNDAGPSSAGSATARAPQPRSLYRDRQRPEIQAALAHYDEIRLLDPCGFLDPTEVSRLGKVTFIGAQTTEATTCDVRFDVPKGQPGVAKIWLGLRDAGRDSVEGSKPGDSDCWYTANTGFIYPNGRPDVFKVNVSQDYAAPRDVPSLCSVAEGIARRAVSRNGSRALRKDSKRVPADNFGSLDPCGPIDALGDRPVEIKGWGNPFDCYFEDPGNTVPNNVRRVSVRYTSILQAPQPKLIKPGYIQIEGVQVKTKEYETDCNYLAFVGNKAPVSGVDETSRRQFVATVEVEGPKVDGGCSEVRTMTEKAVSLYQQR